MPERLRTSNVMDTQDKKKTLTISSNLKKKIDTSSISTSGKKSFSVEKKKTFRQNKTFNKGTSTQNININPDINKKTFDRWVFLWITVCAGTG